MNVRGQKPAVGSTKKYDVCWAKIGPPPPPPTALFSETASLSAKYSARAKVVNQVEIMSLSLALVSFAEMGRLAADAPQ